MFEKVVIIDCRGHLLGRLASTVAKELLTGQRVVCVRAEEINITGSLYRNKLKYAEFMVKKTNTNPKRGPFHFRGPARMLHRAIRGMMRCSRRSARRATRPTPTSSASRSAPPPPPSRRRWARSASSPPPRSSRTASR
ncbi:ribosomal protein L13 domain-containing protein, partial [Pavlovales sp. CCMP2436]